MGRRLYVGNLSYATSEADLRQAFARCGSVVDVKIVTDRETGRSRGFGFVEMSTDDEAASATSTWSGQELQGRSLTVNEAQERSRGSAQRPAAPFQPDAGGGGGGGDRRGSGGRGKPRRGPARGRRDDNDWD